MSRWLKRLVNGGLSLVDLKLVRARAEPRIGFDLGVDLRRVIDRDRPICLDVGANMGQTIDMLQATFSDPLIHAFEPSAACFAQLDAREFGGRVVLHPLALGSESGTREFINYEKSFMSSFLTLDDSPENRFRRLSATSRERVEVATVDRFLEREGIEAIDLLKIDTQGFDLEVLRGADHSLRDGRVRHVLVELNFVKMYEGQCTPDQVTEFLGARGLYLIDHYAKVRQGLTLAWSNALFGRRDTDAADRRSAAALMEPNRSAGPDRSAGPPS